MVLYNWQQNDWPNFSYRLEEVEDDLFAFAEKTGHIAGLMKALPEEMKMEAIINAMVAEALKTSEIEGEYLSHNDILSSIRKNLGLVSSPHQVRDKKAAGIGKLIIDVRNTYSEDLTGEKLFAWDKMLFPVNSGIDVGVWRSHKEPMQVVSGAMGKEKYLPNVRNLFESRIKLLLVKPLLL